MDAVHYKVREEGRYISKAIYTLLGLTVDGNKEILGIYLLDNESASYWLRQTGGSVQKSVSFL